VLRAGEKVRDSRDWFCLTSDWSKAQQVFFFKQSKSVVIIKQNESKGALLSTLTAIENCSKITGKIMLADLSLSLISYCFL